jgi:hypothetical protein
VVVILEEYYHITDGYTFVFLKIDDASKPSSHPEKQQASGVRNLENCKADFEEYRWHGG